MRSWLLVVGLLAVGVLAVGCGSTEPECFECGLGEQWDRVERERARRRAEEAKERAAVRTRDAGRSEATPVVAVDAGSAAGTSPCRPVTRCPAGGGKGARCGELGCPGATLHCGCRYGLSCQGGVCMPPQRACDPLGHKDVCRGPVERGGRCGAVSAGCPGATVQCSCASGLQCVEGHCR